MNGMRATPFDSDLMLIKAASIKGQEFIGFYVYKKGAFIIHKDNPCLMTRINPYAICRNSGIRDRNGNYVFEYDLLKLTHGMQGTCYGYLVWEGSYKAWKIRQYTEFGGCSDVDKYTIEVVGNIILSDEDAAVIYNQDKEAREREVVIDTSYCPTKFKK